MNARQIATFVKDHANDFGEEREFVASALLEILNLELKLGNIRIEDRGASIRWTRCDRACVCQTCYKDLQLNDLIALTPRPHCRECGEKAASA